MNIESPQKTTTTQNARLFLCVFAPLREPTSTNHIGTTNQSNVTNSFSPSIFRQSKNKDGLELWHLEDVIDPTMLTKDLGQEFLDHWTQENA